MTVRELVQHLYKFHPEHQVWHWSDQEGNRISEILIAHIRDENAIGLLPGEELELPE